MFKGNRNRSFLKKTKKNHEERYWSDKKAKKEAKEMRSKNKRK